MNPCTCQCHCHSPSLSSHTCEPCCKQIKTLRDEFACAALTGLLANTDLSIADKAKDSYSKFAYEYADAMMKARESKE